MTPDLPTALTDALENATVRSLVNVTDLPPWMQVAALGRDMRPLAEHVVAALAPLIVADREAHVAARLAAVETLADEWRYKGEFGWGAWQEGHGPDFEGHVLDQCAADLRAALATPPERDQEGQS